MSVSNPNRLGNGPAAKTPPFTDLGNAHRLIARHGRDLRFCHAWQQWLVWDGRRWRRDDTAEAERRVQAVVQEMWDEAEAEVRKARGGSKPALNKAQQLQRHALASQAQPRMAAMLRAAQPFHVVSIDHNEALQFNAEMKDKPLQ